MSSPISVHPVRTPGERRAFLTFPWRIYRDDPLWVPPLLPEMRKRIDPERGAFFQRGGEADFFIARRDGHPVGTICAGEDKFSNGKRERQECIFGFFECVNDLAVAEALVRAAKNWAEARGLNVLFGPFNLDYEDGYGLLIEGRDRPPVLLCGHTPPYYEPLFESLGFKPARGDNLAYAIDLEDRPALCRLSRLADRLRERGEVKIRPANLDDFEGEVDRVHHLLNRALAHLPDHIGWHRSAVKSMFESFRAIADPDLVLFAEIDGETVGWFPGVPNLNEAFIHANGLRYPWDYLKLGWYLRHQPECLTVKSVLVLPEYWDTGVSVLLFDEMRRRARARGYSWVDLSLTSEDNPRTPTLAERLGARLYKRYRVYRLYLT